MNRANRVFIMILTFCFVTTALSGCAGLRKKFIRQKKAARQEKFIPVLEPVEYQARYKMPAERYKKAYGLWKVWVMELDGIIDRGGTDKRSQYAIEQLIAQCESMGQLLQESKRSVMEEYMGKAYSVKAQFEKPESMRNRYRVESDLRAHTRGVREDLSPDAVKDFYFDNNLPGIVFRFFLSHFRMHS